MSKTQKYLTIALCHPMSLFIEVTEWKGMEIIMNHDGRLIAFVSYELCFPFIAYTLPVLRELRRLHIQIDLDEEARRMLFGTAPFLGRCFGKRFHLAHMAPHQPIEARYKP